MKRKESLAEFQERLRLAQEERKEQVRKLMSEDLMDLILEDERRLEEQEFDHFMDEEK